MNIRSFLAAFGCLSHLLNLVSADPCAGNTPTTRSEWCGLSINSDYYTEVPDTGVTREYWLEVDNTTAAPDGVERIALLVNGSFPGPTLYADWGDHVKVHVKNNLQNNGTSIHFHGIRQNMTNPNDGACSITQCPTAPGDSVTYEWRATQYGHTFYHAHYSLQAWDGVFGGIVINGPASANYDEEAGLMWLTDWDHRTADAMYPAAETGGEPEMQTALFNNTNIWTLDNGTVVGQRFQTSLTPGKSYRLRVINSAMSTLFKFEVDNHNLTVIAADLVPIEPYTVETLAVGVAQRFDVILTLNQADVATDFWMRAIPQICASYDPLINNTDIKGILHYGNSTGQPATSAFNYTSSCDDETQLHYNDLVPVVPVNVDKATWFDTEDSGVNLNSAGYYRWYMGPTNFVAEWDNPTLMQIYNNDGVVSNTTFNKTQHAVILDEPNKWIIVDIEMTINVPHPMHLHGHDFAILAQGLGSYTTNTTLNYENPPRRDTVVLPALGYVVIAFKTDNPGAWLMHCHMGWHQEEGFAVQFVERATEIPGMVNSTSMEKTCANWNAYTAKTGLVETDSGI